MKSAGVIDLLAYERKHWEQGVHYVAGVDEAGRGPLAGPVVAAAVIFEPGIRIDGVTDSKKLTAKSREQYFHKIKTAAVCIGVGIVDHDVIDRINILQASLLAMNKAIGQLSVRPERLLVDGNFFRSETIPVENIIKGDALSHSIAAASIIAKVTRDSMMNDLHVRYPVYGFDQHKGYGTKSHIEAIRIHGYSPVHRRSFHVDSLKGI
jgi:ribonuclease HII